MEKPWRSRERLASGGENLSSKVWEFSQPVEITFFQKIPSRTSTLQLCKFDWKKPEKTGSTKGTGIQTFKVRTEGDLKIFVASSQGERPYQLAVWVGDEMRPAMKSVLSRRMNIGK